MLDEGGPIFSQVAEKLADEIAEGRVSEGDRVPSTNELASFYRINPATAAKGLNVLISEGLLEKRRGIGMFVAEGARDRLVAERRRSFVHRFIEPMVEEAKRLDLDADALAVMVRSALDLRGGVAV
jgi:GntR family transcriptional regulator